MRLFDAPSVATTAITPLKITPPALPGPKRAIKAKRGGRKCTWIPRAFNEADINRGMKLVEEWGPDHRTRDRVVMNFEMCCHLSGLHTRDPRAALGVLGQMANSGLGPGTSDTYIKYINKLYRMTSVSKAAAARHADYDSKHAADIPDDVLWRFVNEADLKWQAILYILYTAGLRSRAVRFLRRSRIYIPSQSSWGSEELEFNIKIDKTRKLRALRAILKLPKDWQWLLPPPSTQTWDFLTFGDPQERLFDGINATKINHELSRMAARLSLPRPTTYSFRRAYVNRIAPLVRNKKHLAEFTLHFEPSTVEAFYMRTRAEKRNMA